MINVVFLFLIGMMVLAVAGRLRRPGGKKPRAKGTKCRTCGRYLIGKGPCSCGAGGKA